MSTEVAAALFPFILVGIGLPLFVLIHLAMQWIVSLWEPYIMSIAQQIAMHSATAASAEFVIDTTPNPVPSNWCCSCGGQPAVTYTKESAGFMVLGATCGDCGRYYTMDSWRVTP